MDSRHAMRRGTTGTAVTTNTTNTTIAGRAVGICPVAAVVASTGQGVGTRRTAGANTTCPTGATGATRATCATITGQRTTRTTGTTNTA
ncbi:hypothetical protein, partial [Mycolicibacter arupensis]